MKTSSLVIQWRKEIRGILPVWAGVLAMLWLPTLLGFKPRWASLDSIQMFTFLIGSALLGAVVYAREFQDRTMLWQLLQPVSRMSVLWRKGVLLLVALATVGASYYHILDTGRASGAEGLFVGIILPLVALASVCFWSLLLRNVLAASVVSLATPTVLVIVCLPLLNQLVASWQSQLAADEAFMQWVPYLVMGGFLGLYALATGAGALLLWRRLQLPGEAVAISHFDVRVVSRLTSDTVFRARSWWWALVRKEAGLLRFVIWVAVFFVVGGGAYVIADRLLDHLIQSAANVPGQGRPWGLPHDSGPLWWRDNLHTWGRVLFSFHLALVPALCGALAFCEETYFGNRAWQLCQPARRAAQWLIKLGVAAGYGVVAGLVLPLVVYLVAVPANNANLGREVFVQTVTLHVLLFSLAAWCASASRSTVMALMKTFLLVFGLFLVNQNGLDQHLGFPSARFDWRLMVWPLSLIALAFSLANFKTLDVRPRDWCLQVVAAVLVSFAVVFMLKSFQ